MSTADRIVAALGFVVLARIVVGCLRLEAEARRADRRRQ